jgi:hypothetical protein
MWTGVWLTAQETGADGIWTTWTGISNGERSKNGRQKRSENKKKTTEIFPFKY